MDYRAQTLKELSTHASRIGEKQALIGFDGFVDTIVHPVAQRHGQGDNFDPMPLITDFGGRISAAAGESANIELYPVMEKLGGNGPIMANAMSAGGAQVTYVGALGQPLHPVFQPMAERCAVHSIADAAHTTAVEFEDGKIMLGMMKSLDLITYPRVISQMGEGKFFDAFNRCDLFGAINWTMTPNLTGLLNDLLSKVLPHLGPKETGRTFFFDLCDPAKRSKSDLRNVLSTFSRFRSHGAVTLGLNLAEGKQVARVLDLSDKANGPDDLRLMAERIRTTLELTTVVIHPREGAACATRDDTWYAQGPFCAKPKISTGAGDHFNAGFSLAQMVGLSPAACLTVAVCTSGQYVRTAQSPSLSDTANFLERWMDDEPKLGA